MNKVGIVVTGSFLHSEETRKCEYLHRDIDFTINFSDKSFNGNELSQENFFKEYRLRKEIAKTSQPSYQNIKDVLEKYLDVYERIFVIAPSREVSGTYQGILNVSNEINAKNDNKVILLEANSIAISETYIVEQIIRNIEKKISINLIEEKIKKIKFTTYVTPGDVEFLKLSGRVSGVAALMVGMLKIRPIISMEPFEKPTIISKGRGFKSILKFLNKEVFTEKIEKVYITLIELQEKEKEELLKVLKDRNVNYEFVEEATSVIATHFGPNTVGMYVIEK